MRPLGPRADRSLRATRDGSSTPAAPTDSEGTRKVTILTSCGKAAYVGAARGPCRESAVSFSKKTKRPRSGKPRGRTKSTSEISPARTYFPDFGQYHRPRGLNGRVRNGIGCGPPGMGTGQEEGTGVQAVEKRITARHAPLRSQGARGRTASRPRSTHISLASGPLARTPDGREKVVKPVGQLVPVR